MSSNEAKPRKVVYCHFSFRRPKNVRYGIFAVSLYADSEGKIRVATKVKALDLWQNQQHVTAIQSYANALDCLWEWQGKLIDHGVTNILLVTNNITLAKWIENPKKNKNYTPFMNRAVENHIAGSNQEFKLPIGLCEPRDSEKSAKYCREDLIENKRPTYNSKGELIKNSGVDTKLSVSEYRTMADIVKDGEPDGIDAFMK